MSHRARRHRWPPRPRRRSRRQTGGRGSAPPTNARRRVEGGTPDGQEYGAEAGAIVAPGRPARCPTRPAPRSLFCLFPLSVIIGKYQGATQAATATHSPAAAVRLAESGVGAGREFPECSDKGAERPAPHGATGKAFFRPPVRIRRIRGNPKPMRWRAARRPPVSTPNALILFDGTARRADGGGTALRRILARIKLPYPKASSRSCLSH